MKVKKAISILTEQSEKLKQLELFTTHNWTVETQTYLSEFFGKGSYQSEHFRMNLTDIKSNEKKEKIISFLNDCINIISNKGLYKSPKSNFLSTIPDWLLSLIIPALVVLGTLLGKYLSDVQNIELKRENKILLNKLSVSPTDSITNKDKDLSNKPK